MKLSDWVNNILVDLAALIKPEVELKNVLHPDGVATGKPLKSKGFIMEISLSKPEISCEDVWHCVQR